MKKKLLYIPAVLLLLLLGSCEKYLDIKSNGQNIYIETAKDLQGILDDYSNMNTVYPSDGEASAGDYFTIESQYNRLALEEQGIYTWEPTVVRPDVSQWKPGYFAIYASNVVLDNLEKDRIKSSADQATLDGLRGAALFYRGFALWQLAQLYAKPYTASSAGSDPGIPVRVTSDINDKSVRGTVQQTYDRIIQDLNDAAGLLPVTSPNNITTQPAKAAAYAMLARVYLSMEDYPNALSSANSALQLKSSSPNNGLLDYKTLASDQMNSTAPFNFTPRFSNPEVIFHAVTTSSTLLRGSASKDDCWARIDPALVNSYDANDLRKTVFFKPVSETPVSYFFTGNYEPTTDGRLFCGLAVDELYLVRAECYARAGNANAAMDDLNALLSKRWKTGTYVPMTAASAQDALDKVVTERRKELVMRVQRWTDLRRLNKDARYRTNLTRKLVTADGSESIVGTLPANDLRYVLLIPNDEILNAGIAQNQR